MRLRNLFEAPEKTAAFAFGRLNPATNGHELLVEEIKKQGVDSFLFLSDRPAKVPTDPLSPQEKLDWARKSFNGIAVGLAKTALIAADRLYKMGYTNLIYLEGEPKMGKVIQTYNGQKKDLHDYNFKSIDLVRLTRDPDAEDPTGMSASKLRQTVLDNNLQGFMSGVTKQAQPHAEEMFKKLQGIMGVDAVEERSLSKDEEKKKEKYVKGMKKNKSDFKDRYGRDAEAVMYATATKMAKEDGKGRTTRGPALTAQPHMTGLSDPDGDYGDGELRVYTKAYRDMYKKAKAAQAKADATGGPGASYTTKPKDITWSSNVFPKLKNPKKPRT